MQYLIKSIHAYWSRSVIYDKLPSFEPLESCTPEQKKKSSAKKRRELAYTNPNTIVTL